MRNIYLCPSISKSFLCFLLDLGFVCLYLCVLRYQGFLNLAFSSEGLAGLIKGRVRFVLKAVYVYL